MLVLKYKYINLKISFSFVAYHRESVYLCKSHQKWAICHN